MSEIHKVELIGDRPSDVFHDRLIVGAVLAKLVGYLDGKIHFYRDWSSEAVSKTATVDVSDGVTLVEYDLENCLQGGEVGIIVIANHNPDIDPNVKPEELSLYNFLISLQL